MVLFKEFSDGKYTCTEKLNKWLKKNPNDYDYEVAGFTGDPTHGESILIRYENIN